MKLDLAFVLIDLGEPWYKTAASEMIRSARRAYKDHDMRIVQLTDSRSPHHPDADGVFTLATEVGKEQMCQAKGHLIAEYALQADRPVIFCDVDIIWNHGGLANWTQFECVSLLERQDILPMPYNAGIIVSGVGDNRPFWNDYRNICSQLPPEVCGWWGDQFALLAAAHASEGLGRVGKMYMEKIAPAIDTLPSEPLTTPAVHFKGNRKSMMIPYARMLDKGEGFGFVRPSSAIYADDGPPIRGGAVMPDAAMSAAHGWAF